MTVIGNANINKNVGRRGYNVGIIVQIELSYSEWILMGKVSMYSANLFTWMSSTEGGRNFEERGTIGLFFPQICIIIEVNSTRSQRAIVFDCGCCCWNE